MKRHRSEPDVHVAHAARPKSTWKTVLSNTILQCVLLAAVVVAAMQLMAQVKAKQLEVVRKQQELQHMHQDIAVLEERNRLLKYSVQYLKTDDGIEKVAREKLDLVKPGEVTFQVIPPPPPLAPKATPPPPPAPPPPPDGWMQKLISHF